MRIVIATETFLPHVDGIVTRLTQTITNLRRAGDEVMVIAPDRPNSPKEFLGAQVVTIPAMTLPMYPDVRIGIPVLPRRARQAINAFKPDIMHVAGPAFLGLGPVLFARWRKIPLVESYHVQFPEYVRRYHFGPLVPLIWWYLRAVHNRAKLNLATSLPMVRDLRERGFQHMHHWRAGVDAERFHPSKASAEWRLRISDGHPDDVVLICVARLAVEKSIEKLAVVLRDIPGIRLALVGDGPERARLEEQFAGLPVKFMGMLLGPDLDAAYASADCFVLPSSTETLGLVALEAMAAGIPAVVANRGGLPDLVIDGQTGYLFDPDAPSDLTSRILLIKNAKKRRELARTARQHAERFSWSQTTKQLRGYYARVLGREVRTTIRQKAGDLITSD